MYLASGQPQRFFIERFFKAILLHCRSQAQVSQQPWSQTSAAQGEDEKERRFGGELSREERGSGQGPRHRVHDKVRCIKNVVFLF